MASVKQFVVALFFVVAVMLGVVGIMSVQTAEASHDEPFPFYVYDGPDGTVILCEDEHGMARCVVMQPLAPLVCNMDTQECKTPEPM